MMETENQKKNNTTGENILFIALIIVAAIIAIAGIQGCSAPKEVIKYEKVIEYRDRIVHDTATVEVEKEVEKIVTRDTVSHLENTWAKSDAMVSEGFLHHSLESKPKIIRIPVDVIVHDTLWRESEIKEIKVPVEKQLTFWQQFRLRGFWWLLGAVVALLLWTFRKVIFKI